MDITSKDVFTGGLVMVGVGWSAATPAARELAFNADVRAQRATQSLSTAAQIRAKVPVLGAPEIARLDAMAGRDLTVARRMRVSSVPLLAISPIGAALAVASWGAIMLKSPGGDSARPS